MTEEENEMIFGDEPDKKFDYETMEEEEHKADFEERMKVLQPDAEHALRKQEEFAKAEIEVDTATLEYLIDKKKRTFNIEIPVKTIYDDDGVTVKKIIGKRFVVRRPSDKDRMESLMYSPERLASMDARQRAKIDNQFYEYLSNIVIDPKIPPEIWKNEIGKDIITQLTAKIVLLSAETDDTKLVDFFTLR